LAAPTPTTLSLSVSPTTATLAGQSVALTATLDPYTVGPPTTTTDGESVKFFSGSSYLGSGTLSGGVAKITTITLTPGSDALQAAYPGDGNYDPSSSSTVNVTVASILLTSSPNPSTYGQTVTFVATVPSGEQGTVTFKDGGTTLGTMNLSGSTASFTSSTLTAGSHDVAATYNGDSSHAAATSPIVTQVVNTVTPSLGVTTSGASAYGDNVTITATLSSGPTGSVVFTSGTTTLGTGTINTSGIATISTSVLPIGSDPITASYGGDGNYNSANASTTQTVGKRTSTSTLTSSTNPSVPGASVTFTDSLLPAGLTGTVTFTSGTTLLGTSPVAGGIATLKMSNLPLGSDPITATYSGDTNDSGSVATMTQTVAKLTPVITVTTPGSSIYGASVSITVSLSTSATGTVTITSNGVTLGSGSASGPFTITTSVLPAGTNLITASYPGDSTNNTATGTADQTVSQTTLALSSSLNPSNVNQSVTFTATLPTNATGMVTFINGATTLGTSPITGGVATLKTSTLPAGGDVITASYLGDSNNSSASGSLTQTVNKTTPTVTVTTSGPSNYGDPVQITVTVPTGTTGTVIVTSGGTQIGTGTISSGTVTVATTTLPVGSDPINVVYSGDSSNNPSNGTVTQVVSKATPVVTLVSSVNPSAVNQSVSFTASLSIATASGTITFYDGSTLLVTVPVTNGVASTATSTLTAGPHTVLATYNGDANTNAANSASLIQTVNKLTPVLSAPSVSSTSTTVGSQETISETVPPGVTGPVTFYNGSNPIGTAPIANGVASITVTLPVGTDSITASTPADANNNAATSPATVVTITKTIPTIALSSSINPSAAGQSVTFTAIAPTAATGPIAFLDGTTPLGTSSLSNGQASFTTSSLTTGSHIITADYDGDSSYSAANSGPLTQTVNKASPSLPPPAVSATTSTVGSSETISETVPPGVTGPVTFFNGSTPIGTAPIVNGVATITISNLPVGTDSITASTPADANNNAATSPATSVTVTKTTPSLPPPTVSSTTPAPDTPVTITEQVPPGTTGPVTFSDGGTVIGTAPVINGSATITVPSLPLGPNPITATVAASDTSNAATSPATQVVVAKITPTVVLSSSANPAAFNASVTFTAAVPAAASGSITFSDGATVLGTGAVNSAGIAVFTTSNLAIGSHTITATYSGNSSYETATSAPLAQTIGKIPTAVTLSPSAPTQLLNNSVIFAATVSAASPTPTGTVTFLEGTTVLGTVALNTNGTVVALAKSADAAYATSALATGSHQIVAVYSGDASFAPSTSAPVTYIVQDFTNTVNGTASQNLFPGDKTSYTFDLAPLGATTFLSDLNLTVTGLPPGTTYTFTPATITAGSGTTSVVLNVVTSSSLSAQNHMLKGDPMSQRGLPIALGMLGLFGLGVVRKRGRKMPRLLMALLLLLGSLLPVAGLSGCAGGYFTLTPTPYSVNVTGTEGSIQHTATATLVVQ
jgi:Bacterial Ig-like domain (group 3)